jgi:hypothetical protein
MTDDFSWSKTKSSWRRLMRAIAELMKAYADELLYKYREPYSIPEWGSSGHNALLKAKNVLVEHYRASGSLTPDQHHMLIVLFRRLQDVELYRKI